MLENHYRRRIFKRGDEPQPIQVLFVIDIKELMRHQSIL